jgi:hypothetical protein
VAELARIHEDDIVEVNIRGRRGIAEVRAKSKDRLEISPITPGFGYFTAKANQVVRHWRLTKNKPRSRN